jgi:23S rRNA (guanosine2251-2'-O)-methyltransferase
MIIYTKYRFCKKKDALNMDEKILISGAISVKAALECGKREIFEVYVDKNKIGKSKDVGYIKGLCEKLGVPFVEKDEAFFDTIVFGLTHGGVGASVGDIRTTPEDELLNEENPFIAVLEGIEDPFNFGSAIRTLYAAGATGIVLPHRNWMSAAGTVLKASAGASERITCAVTDDISGFLQKAKAKGITVIAADRRDAEPLYSQSLNMPLALIIGGEKRGISSDALKMADRRVYIPYGRDFRNALAASGAVAVFAFEIYRQRSV